MFSFKDIHLFSILCFVLLLKKSCSDLIDDGINVYGHVPGLNESEFYRLRIRKYGDEYWHEPFTFVTECTAEKFCNTTGVYNHMTDWSNSYINFEMLEGVEVEIEISKLWGEEPIQKAVIHPKTASNNCEVRSTSNKQEGMFNNLLISFFEAKKIRKFIKICIGKGWKSLCYNIQNWVVCN